MAVDVHVFRVTGRLGLIGPKINVDKAHDVLEALFPPDEIYGIHVALNAQGRQASTLMIYHKMFKRFMNYS